MRVSRYNTKGHTSQTYEVDVVLAGKDKVHIHLQPIHGSSQPIRLAMTGDDFRELVRQVEGEVPSVQNP